MRIFTQPESLPGASLRSIYCGTFLKGIEITVFGTDPAAGDYTLVNTALDGFILVFADCGGILQFDDQPPVHSRTGFLSALYCGCNEHRLAVRCINGPGLLVTVFLPGPWLTGFLGNSRYSDVLMARMQPGDMPVYYASSREQSILLSRMSGHGPAGSIDKAMLQEQLLHLLETYFCSNYSGAASEKRHGQLFNKEDMELIRTAEEYILQEYCSDTFTVQLLVKQIAANYSRLNALFKSKYGMKVSEYIRLKRIEKSREMMAGGNKSISEIAYEIGYSSISNYILAFKKVYRVTPGSYKRKIA